MDFILGEGNAEAKSHWVDQRDNLEKVISMYFGDGEVDQSAFHLIVAKY